MNTIRIYLTESGRIADLQKDFPLYQGQFQNKLLNVFVPTSILAPMFTSSGAVSADYVASTSTKIGMTYTARDGSIKTSKNYYMRYLKTLMYKGVEYALYERKLPKEFTFYAGQGENSPVLIINVVNIEQQSGDTPPLVLSVITSQTCHLDVMQSTFLDRDELNEPSELENLNAQVQALNAIMPLKQDKEDNNIDLKQKPVQKTVVGAINDLGELVETAQTAADANKAEIGNLTALTTDEKATLVGAINEVDNHADNATTLANNAVATANGAVATANEAKTTAQTAETNANSAVDKATEAQRKAQEAITKAENNVYAVGFMTLQEAITAVNGYDNTVLKTNDNILVVAQGSPDLYVTSVEATNIPYNFTTVDKFNDDLVKNTVLQIGYYKVAFYETDGQPVTVAYQNVAVKSTDWVASTEFADFPYEAKIPLSNFVDYKTVPQVVFDIADTMSGNYAPICKSGDKCVYIYGKVQNEITLKTVITFAPNVNGASVTGGGYNNRGKWVASTTYEIDDLVYTDNGQYVCIEGITSTTSPEQDTQHWQATFVATGKTKNGLTISGQNTDGSAVQKTFDGSQAVEVSFDEQTMTAKEVNGVLKVGAKGTIPEALPQEASAVKSGNLPTTGWSTLDEGWKENTLPAYRNWKSVTYGNGKYVAVAWDSDKGAYSTDGITWTEMGLPASQQWQSVTYGNGKFVAVVWGSGNGAYSTDGINWTSTTMPASRNWSSVTYGNDKFVAIATSSTDKGAYSADGINWVEMTLPASRNWSSVTYGNGKFVAVASSNGGKGAYSTDGINWTEMSMLVDYKTFQSVTYGNGTFVAVSGGSDKGAYSTDGITWREMGISMTSRSWSVTYGNDKFVAVAYGSSEVVYSTNGIDWRHTSSYSRSWNDVTYGNGKFVAIASNDLYYEYWETAVTYAISDTSITANSDVLMELTDEGGVKAHSMEAGKMTVIRDTVPTQAIPYTYKVKQTNASGQFTLVNHFVPSIPESPTSLPVTYKKVSGSLPTSGWSEIIVQNLLTKNISVIQGTTLTETNKIYSQTIDAKYYGVLQGWKIKLLEDNKVYDAETAMVTVGNEQYMEISYKARTGFKFNIYLDKQGNIFYADHGSGGSTYTFSGLSNSTVALHTYTISDTSITANTAVKMYLTDEGGVKAQSKAVGSIQVIRDTVPTTAIPYEYEVEQTSAEGLFEVINAYVPTKTSELTNDSGFVKTSEANTFTAVQTFSNADGIKTDRVHNLDNNDAWYNFDGSNNRFGSPSRPTIIRTSEARPRAQVPSGSSTVTKEIALLEDVQGSEWAVNNDNTAFPKNGWYLISNMVVESYQLAPFIARVTAQNNKLVIVTQDLEGHDVTLAMTIGSDRRFADAIRVHTYTIANNAVTATSTSLSITTLLTDGQFSFDYKLLY